MRNSPSRDYLYLHEIVFELSLPIQEKIKSLVEDVSFENADAYAKKLSTIKESYFGTAKAPESTENVDTVNQDSNDSNTVADMSSSMARYTAAISRGKSRDIYGN